MRTVLQIARFRRTRSSPGRIAVSILVVCAVLLSSLHHLACDIEIGLSPAGAFISASADQSHSAAAADGHQLPAHCAFCLCHAAPQSDVTIHTDRDLGALVYFVPPEHCSVSFAGFPLFKPPRA
jgi:hypothetical protein